MNEFIEQNIGICLSYSFCLFLTKRDYQRRLVRSTLLQLEYTIAASSAARNENTRTRLVLELLILETSLAVLWKGQSVRTLSIAL